MTLVDTNLLVYAASPGAPEHEASRAWMEERLDGDGIVLCWPVIYSFLRLVSSPHVLGDNAVTLREAWMVVSGYLMQPRLRIVSHGSGHAAIAAELARTPGLRSADVPDIEMAALAIEHGLVLASHDSGFRRFSGLRAVDPIGSE